MDPRPVFEYDQVLTEWDLKALYNGFLFQYQHTHWWQFETRKQLAVALRVCISMMNWMKTGKQVFPFRGK